MSYDKWQKTIEFEDDNGNIQTVHLSGHTNDEGTTSVARGDGWKQTVHSNENCDKDPSYHYTQYDNNNVDLEEKTWYDKDNYSVTDSSIFIDGEEYDNMSEYDDN